MKLNVAVGIVCIAAIIVAAMSMGYNGVLAASGLAIIGGLLGYEAKKQVDKKRTNLEALEASLRRAKYPENFIKGVMTKVKGGKR